LKLIKHTIILSKVTKEVEVDNVGCVKFDACQTCHSGGNSQKHQITDLSL